MYKKTIWNESRNFNQGHNQQESGDS